MFTMIVTALIGLLIKPILKFLLDKNFLLDFKETFFKDKTRLFVITAISIFVSILYSMIVAVIRHKSINLDFSTFVLLGGLAYNMYLITKNSISAIKFENDYRKARNIF